MEREKFLIALEKLGITQWKLDSINGQRMAIFKEAGVLLVDLEHIIDVVAERDFYDLTFLEKCPHERLANFLKWPTGVVSKLMGNTAGRLEIVTDLRAQNGTFKAFLEHLIYWEGISSLFSESLVGYVSVYTRSDSGSMGTVYKVFFNQDAWAALEIKKAKQ